MRAAAHNFVSAALYISTALLLARHVGEEDVGTGIHAGLRLFYWDFLLGIAFYISIKHFFSVSGT